MNNLRYSILRLVGFAAFMLVSLILAKARPTPRPTATCSDGIGITPKQSHDAPLSLDSSSIDSSSCYQLYIDGSEYQSEGNNIKARDTLRYVIEHCNRSLAKQMPFAFGYLNGAESGIGTEWLNFREWLFSVLYLSSDTNYYCPAVDDLLSTFNYTTGPRGSDEKGKIAVENFIVATGRCPLSDAYHRSAMKLQWGSVHAKWQDTVKDTLATPFDSTLPTLQQIGFEILLGPQSGVVNYSSLPTTVLGSISASPNPFASEQMVAYTLNIPATLTVEVFDALGTKVLSQVPSVFTTNGDYTFSLRAALPSGTYYVRFAVPEGEVKTIKVVKE